MFACTRRKPSAMSRVADGGRAASEAGAAAEDRGGGGATGEPDAGTASGAFPAPVARARPAPAIQNQLDAMLAWELDCRPAHDYVETVQLETRMCAAWRSKLVDWMVEFMEEFAVPATTVEIATNFMDRFLSHVPVSKRYLQLIAMAALFLAFKVHVGRRITVARMAEHSGGLYTAQHLRNMERRMLSTLGWSLCPVTPTQIYSQLVDLAPGSTGGTHDVAEAMLLLAAVEYPSLTFRPSTLALAALVASRRLTQCPPVDAAVLPDPLDQWAGTQDLEACQAWLADLYLRAIGARVAQVDPMQAPAPSALESPISVVPGVHGLRVKTGAATPPPAAARPDVQGGQGGQVGSPSRVAEPPANPPGASQPTE